MNRIVCLLLAIILLSLVGCSGTLQREVSPRTYQSYRDIPDVTQAEIDAIEALRAQAVAFVYGMCPSTEAFYDENGALGGFTPLFCEWLTALFGIPFEPEIAEWDTLNLRLKDGTIDFTGEMTASPERRETYSMTSAIAERSIKIFKLRDTEEASEIAKERIPVFAFLSGTNTGTLAAGVAEYEFESVFVDNYEEAVQKLRNREIDSFLDDSPGEEAFNGYADILTEDFFPMVYTQVSLAAFNPALAPIISVMQKYLDAGAMYQLTKLYNEGHRAYLRHKLSFALTTEEKAYIAAHADGDTPVAIALEADVYPVTFYNTRESEWQGIASDVLREIAELTGLRFEVVNTPRRVACHI